MREVTQLQFLIGSTVHLKTGLNKDSGRNAIGDYDWRAIYPSVYRFNNILHIKKRFGTMLHQLSEESLGIKPFELFLNDSV